VGGGWGGGGSAARAPCLPNVYKLGNSNVNRKSRMLTFHQTRPRTDARTQRWNVIKIGSVLTFHSILSHSRRAHPTMECHQN
jgi:hypothetical protein